MSFGEIVFFIHILFVVTILPLLINLLSIPKFMKILTPKNLRANNHKDAEELMNKTIKFTDYILNRNFLIYRNTCLKRSLVLYHFLRRLGINVHICFGIRFNQNLLIEEGEKKIDGHAWLFYKGKIFLERDVKNTTRYKKTYCFPTIHI